MRAGLSGIEDEEANKGMHIMESLFDMKYAKDSEVRRQKFEDFASDPYGEKRKEREEEYRKTHKYDDFIKGIKVVPQRMSQSRRESLGDIEK